MTHETLNLDHKQQLFHVLHGNDDKMAPKNNNSGLAFIIFWTVRLFSCLLVIADLLQF